jgi:hypothetical protein
MALFKALAAEQLKVLFFIFMLGNSFHVLPVPANPAANSCGSDFYRRLLVTHYVLVFESFAAAMLLLVVRMLDADTDASTARWKRAFLGVLHHLAESFSGAAALQAIGAFDDGFSYRTGCNDAYSARSPLLVSILVCLTFVVQCSSLWVARSQK